MISNKLVEKNKASLLSEKERVTRLLAATYDNTAEVEIFERNIAEERDLREQLRRVEAALARVASGTYGRCLAGGEEIPARRLEAAPEAENCVEHEK